MATVASDTELRPRPMALERPTAGEEPDPESCNGLHFHLLIYACEELWTLADDNEDENAEAYDELAETLMTAGGTPLNRDLMTWLKDQLPAPVYEKVQSEARRVEWPFMEPALGVANLTDVPVEEPMCKHAKWSQLQDVIKDGFRSLRGGGKLRRVNAEQKREDEILAHELIREAGELQFNDSLLLVSQRLWMPLGELMHEWDFEVDWQREWGAREDGQRGSSALSSCGQPRTS